MPLAITYPHFMHADPTLLRAFDGLNPNESRFTSTVMLQPVSAEESAFFAFHEAHLANLYSNWAYPCTSMCVCRPTRWWEISNSIV